MTDHEKADAKILFCVPNDDGTSNTETLWAASLGGDQYKLGNSPFYAYDVSWEDIVYAPVCEQQGCPVFSVVVKKSGNRTVRAIFDPPVIEGNESDRILQGLVSLGCSYEGANRSYVSINLPHGVALDAVRDYLIDAEVQWEHADPSYAKLFPE